MQFLDLILERFIVLVQAPLFDQKLLWITIPLFIATLFMTLYFGKYSKEELGWNTAFGNTMVFLFVSFNILQFMYYSNGTGSLSNIFSNKFYTSVTIGLGIAALFLMTVTYYHLLPKNVAFFLFSAPPVNVSVYVLMTIIYGGLPADLITLTAGIILFLIIFTIVRAIQSLEHFAGKPDGLSFSVQPEGNMEQKFLQKLKSKNKVLSEGKKKIENGD